MLVGALNMDEYAYGFTTENSHDGPCHNPHDLARIAGGVGAFQQAVEGAEDELFEQVKKVVADDAAAPASAAPENK